MKPYDVIIIGAGAGGLVVANGATRARKRVLLVERNQWGGDCTNYGCIPSKTLIAEAAKGNRTGALKRVAEIVQQVRSHEDAQALAAMGIETIKGQATFVNQQAIEVAKQHYYGRYFVIAAGSHPFIPPIEGLADTPYLTNETIFDLYEIPKRLAILGAGPIGCELAQAFRHLGTEVTIIHSHGTILSKEEPKAQEVLQKVFTEEGIQMRLSCLTHSIRYEGGCFHICTTEGDLESEHLLVSTGRRPNVDGLGLEKIGVAFSEKGIRVDPYGRTSQQHIFAIGDILGEPYLTHLAENQGRAVLTSLLMPGPFYKKYDKKQALPRCTYTDPEVASVGMSRQVAEKTFGARSLATYYVPLSDVDRAITAGRTEGFLQVSTKKWSSRILGATIVAPRAGDMLQELTMAMLFGIPLRKLARLIHPYPTYSSCIRKAADLWLTRTVFGSVRKGR